MRSYPPILILKVILKRFWGTSGKGRTQKLHFNIGELIIKICECRNVSCIKIHSNNFYFTFNTWHRSPAKAKINAKIFITNNSTFSTVYKKTMLACIDDVCWHRSKPVASKVIGKKARAVLTTAVGRNETYLSSTSF